MTLPFEQGRFQFICEEEIMAFFGILLTILMWGTLAASVDSLHSFPTLMLNGVALTIGGLIGLPWVRYWRMPIGLAVLGSVSMLAYHVMYFYALQVGEPVGVSLIHYLWPLLIVVMTPATCHRAGSLVRRFLGVALGFAGAIFACIAGVEVAQPDAGSLTLGIRIFSYGIALVSAFTWAGYSLLGRRYGSVSSHSVGLFCLVAGIGSLILSNVAGEVARFTGRDTLMLAYLGLGPMGTAFYLWDYGMKRCDPRKVAILSYATPVLSTIALCVHLGRPISVMTWLGSLLVVIAVAITPKGESSSRDPDASMHSGCGTGSRRSAVQKV
jgi:drug/metabolite transporter (DMT)-like permease